jgi:hypothetical protein
LQFELRWRYVPVRTVAAAVGNYRCVCMHVTPGYLRVQRHHREGNDWHVVLSAVNAFGVSTINGDARNSGYRQIHFGEGRMKARLVAHERARKSVKAIQVLGMNSCAVLAAQAEVLSVVVEGATQIDLRSLDGRSAREPMMQNAFAGRGMTAASIERSASTVVEEVS